MKCPVCGTEMILKRTKYTVTREKFVLVLEDISAYVCENCGEVYFTEEMVRKIQEIIINIEQSAKELVVTS